MNDFEAPITPSAVAAIADLVERRLDERMARLQSRLVELGDAQRVLENKESSACAMIIFSGDLDKLIAAFTLATAAAAMGISVSMFFTFWGLVALKKGVGFKGKGVVDKLLTVMLPSRPGRAPTSQLNCFGIGPRIIKYLARKHRTASLEELITLAQELKVRLVACSASMELMGIDRKEVIEGLEYAGATSFLSTALDSKVTLFI